MGHPRRLEQGGGGLKDRRSEPRARSAELIAALNEQVERARDGAEKCLDEWPAEEPLLATGVMLGFTLDRRGLDEVWIEGRSEVPSGPLACISNAVYPIDWSGLTDEPLTVTTWIKYQAPDSGASDGDQP